MESRRLVIVLLNLLLLFFSFNAWSGTPGTQKWVFEIGDTDSSPAIGTDGTIYVGGSGNSFYAINSDGTQKWVFVMPSHVSGSPAIGSDGTIYVQSVGFFNVVDGYLHAIHPDGTEKWKLPTGCESASCPSFGADDTIYVGSTCVFLAIYPDGTNARLNFQERCTNGPWTSSPSIGPDGTIYIGSCGLNQSGVRSIGPNYWWHFRDAGERRSSPAIGSDGIIYVGSESEGGDFYAINPDGTQKWVFDTGTIYSSPTIGGDGTIHIRDSGGRLYAINPDGTEKWTVGFLGDHTTPSTVAIGDDGTVYCKGYQLREFGPYRGGLFAFNPDGTEKWLFEPNSEPLSCGISSPAIGQDGTIYVVLNDRLYAIYSDSKGLAKSSWPMYNHDAQHTGRYGAFPKRSKTIKFLLPLILDDL